ncbi:calmodulin-regulated spectrin-associated protein 3 isoform X2 [Lepisosteus oculatus]|uniref:calmodulin-regulated spectrin-associated protein 3 isoform X2 n=1 Tax=Lepisosteus oculatus TaxID=7918 RepID=UPI0035F50F1A
MVDSNAMRKTFTVPEIKPLDQYDFTRARICASLGWILTKSYGSAESVPEELREPFYSDQYEQEHIKPPVTRLLLSSDLYCRVCGLVLGGEAAPRDNAALLQLLARKGVPPKDQETPITEADLRQRPIKMSAHLAVIDSLMSVCAMETMGRVKMPAGLEQFGADSQWENAVLYWVNKCIQKLRESTDRGLAQRSQPGMELQQSQPSCPTRWYWKLVPIRYRKDKMLHKQTPTFPLVAGTKDLSNGCAIAAVVHYYCPGLLRLEDVCLKDTMSVADSLYNLQLIQDFCQSALKSCCPLALEDLLYAPPALKVNIMTFMAELFGCFEVQKPDFVQPKEPLDLQDPSGLSDCTTPTSANSNSASPAFVFRQPFLPISPQSPGGVPGALTQSTSMPHVEGVGKTWPKRQISRPLSSAVSFSIPFGLDSDVDIVMGNPVGMTRSISSDSLGPNVFQPAPGAPPRATYTSSEEVPDLGGKGKGVGGQTAAQTGQNGPLGSHRASWGTQTPPVKMRMEKDPEGLENGLEESGYADLPTIEEALQIIHSESKMEPRLHPDGAADGFYLHSPDEPAGFRHNGSPSRLSSSAPSRAGMMYRPSGEPQERERGQRRTRRTSEGSRASRDDDSVLRDGSVDSDASEDLPKAPAAPVPAAADGDPRDEAGTGTLSLSSSSDSGVKMTSFAELKKKLVPAAPAAATTETPRGSPEPQMTTWAQRSEESPSKSPALNTEMSQLGARLEEKRRAIEAQKKRIEAIFAKHRQRLGKSAFMQLKKHQDGGGEAEAEVPEELGQLTLEERLARIEDEEEQPPPSEDRDKLADGSCQEKQVTFSPEIRKPEEDAHLGDYNKAVSKLNAALSSLQSDMQRLAEQQQQLMRKKPATQAWVIPASPKPTAAAPPLPSPRPSREPTPRSADLSCSSPSPSPSRKPASHPAPPKSPQPAPRRAQSVPPKSPKHARPLDLKFPPLTRVLTPPNNVDNLPHLRKFSPSQCPVQTSSSFSIGHPRSPIEPGKPVGPIPKPPGPEDDSSETGSSEEPAMFSLELEGHSRPPVGPVVGPSSSRKEPGGGSSSGAPSECSFESDLQPSFNGKRSSLIEISLSSLRGPEEAEGDEGPESFSDSTSDHTEPEQRGGLGFFFKDEARPEDEMAQRRAALLEKQQKRAEELKRRRQWQEQEREARPQSEEGRGRVEDRPPAPRTPPPEGTPQRRGDFTRQEYQRRHQLKIMEDLDKVLRQKPTTVRGVKKQRPKTVFRDDSVLARSPVKGSRLSKVYSHSSLSLSTMANDTGGSLMVKKSPRADSPLGLMSPSRLANQNGEKDWENASTASSPASIPEYTGPKLYKEPSFKSNKFIIHNALSRCCLAGKVNEPQKNKIVEEMEKSKANHFLILFRDSSCQFRAVYTMNPETEEMARLTGFGPRVITPAMVESIYKYSSDRKQFTPIPSKTMSMSVDAFTIQGHLWQSKRPGTPKKPGTPK